MSNSQRVAVITGASQGIGESLVTAYRKLGYAVVANSRTIAESNDPMVATVSGDIALCCGPCTTTRTPHYRRR